MNNKGTHYEQAFEDYLRRCSVPYVAVDQTKKAVFTSVQLKSFDFIVYPNRGRKILADVKGRKFSYQSFQRGRLGQSWVTSDDIAGLIQWEQVFGPDDYVSAFIFAYWLIDDSQNCPFEAIGSPTEPNVHYYRQRLYGFMFAELNDYRRQMRLRSRSWNTVYVPHRQFQLLARPFDTIAAPTKR